MKKVGMVLEGGALRGLYTAGVLDTLLEYKINIDGIIGVSAGALFGINYFSNQKGRAIRYNKKYCHDLRYMGMSSFLLTGNYVNKKFAFYRMTKELDPIDYETFMKNKKDYYVVATNIKSGEAEYLKIINPINQLEELRATSAIPIFSKIIKINHKKYLDGAITDSIPIHKWLNEGYQKNIIVLTQPLNYQKKQLSKWKEILIRLRYYKYPKLVKAILERYQNYNELVKKIINMERNNEVFVIRPSKKINISLSESNPNKYQEVYDMGVNETRKIINKLKEYLEI